MLKQDSCSKVVWISVNRTHYSDQYPVFTHLTELTNFTLCPKEEGQGFHNLKCVQRKCENCGVKQTQLSEQETATEGSPDVDWMRYDKKVPEKN